MIRFSFINLTVLTCLFFVGANETFAQNVLVDLTEEGTLSIVEEFVGGNSVSHSTIDIVTENDVISVRGGSTTLNGEVQDLEFPAVQVKKIECQNIYWLRVFTYPQPLVADLGILSSGFTQVEIAGGDWHDLERGPGVIIGDVEFIDGLDSSILLIDNVDLFGDLSISTGQGGDIANFAQGKLGGSSTGSFGPVNIYGNLSINTGQDGDFLDFTEEWLGIGTYVGGDVEIQMGQGGDYLLGREALITEPDANVSISLGQQ